LVFSRNRGNDFTMHDARSLQGLGGKNLLVAVLPYFFRGAAR
jgi:hypothetical protein